MRSNMAGWMEGISKKAKSGMGGGNLAGGIFWLISAVGSLFLFPLVLVSMQL